MPGKHSNIHGVEEQEYNKRVAKSNGECCGFCRINEGRPATGKNGQNENKEGMQTLAELME